MNLDRIIREGEATYSDHYQENADGTKEGLGWCDTGEFLRQIHDLDGRGQ